MARRDWVRRPRYIIAREMGVNIKATSGPIVERPGDLAALLTNLEEEIFFYRRDPSAEPCREEISRHGDLNRSHDRTGTRARSISSILSGSH
jgi:hypothetical protein